MLENNAIVKISNRDSGSVGYHVQELNITRKFYQTGETKEVTMNELRKLSYQPGGLALIRDCLVIHNEEALKELDPEYEPEYFYGEKEIKDLLLYGTEAQFLDCLDFAPVGVIEIIKKMAVELEINDLAKREAIFKKTGFNVNNAINFNKMSQETDEEVEVKQRRTAAPTVGAKTPDTTAARRTTAPKYTVKK